MQADQRIAHYQIEARLGEGGMGVVYRARDLKLDRIVALKFLPKHLSLDENAKRRFIQEARAASALDHTNICTIHDIAETETGELYIVMAHYEGRTLAELLAKGRMPIEQALDVGAQLARALERAHEAGIVHRDLKPANVLVTDRGEVKLLDFGLAKLAAGQNLTATGTTLGTARYMSPEQVAGEDIDHRTDIWSLGVLLFEMLAGRQPFGGDSPVAAVYSVMHQDPEPMAQACPEAPAAVAALVDACLTRDREGRPRNATAVRETLEGSGAASKAEPVPKRRIRRIVGVAAGLVALVIVSSMLGRGPDEGAMETSSDVVAVLPFTVRGSADLEYLREGLVDLLSANLDGAGTLRSIDPRAVIGSVRSRGLDVTDPEAAAVMATSLGAGRFITGEVLGTGDRLRISATLHDPDSPADRPPTASVEGPVGDLFALIDELAASVLAGSLSGPNARLQRIAMQTSASIPATKAFLKGEQLHRAGLYREAAVAYGEAIALDSTFALAYYKRSVVNDYTDEPDDYHAAAQALRYSGNLSPRDVALIRALRDQRAGMHRAAEQAYRTHVLRYPDEVGALMQIGEILFHDNPRRGRPMGEAREWFERVTELEPGNIEANLHLARLDGLEGRLDDLRQRSDFFNTVAPNSERSIEVEAAYAFAVDDTARQRTVIETLDTMEWYFNAYAAMSAVRYARNPAASARILDARPEGVDFLDRMDVQLKVVRGQYGRVGQFLRDERRLRNPSWDVFDAFLLESGLLEVDAAMIEPLLERLRDADPEELRRTAFVPLHDIITPAVTGFERDWHVAMLLGLLGRFPEAWEIQRRLEQMPDFPATGSLRADAAAALRAELLYLSGDRQGALDVLRTLVYDLPGAALWLSFSDGTRARFLRAELELELGDPAAAKPLYEGFSGSFSASDPTYIAIAYERLGRIAEKLGDIDEALFNYTKFVEAWRDADPELVPLRDEVRRRIQDLAARRPR